ncbi:MAG: MFS transporter [Alphaproteobacteria bacterium]|nr:MFS transporter [Alphaproteobacteria bacterium]
MTDAAAPLQTERSAATDSAFAVIFSLSFCHMLNDMMQSMVPAIYPILKESYALDYAQIGLITLAFQCTASLFQPIVGLTTDRRPMPYSLAVGMAFTLCGLVLMSRAASYPAILAAAALIGVGSAVFHPEASRVARLASGGRHGLAQSLFQVGGNTGSAIGPLLAAFIIVPHGQWSIIWFSAAAFVAMSVLFGVGRWYAGRRKAGGTKRHMAGLPLPFPRGKVAMAVAVLVALIFSKTFYTASLTSYYTFYLIHKFDVSVQFAQIALFAFLTSLALGTLVGGWLGDRIGRIPIIWFSILGPLPFTLAMPYAGLVWTIVLSLLIGLMMSSAFSAILVYAQELMPGRVGMVAGLFFGFSFGLGGLGAAAIGRIADFAGIDAVYTLCSYLPFLGLLTALLPRQPSRAAPVGT